MLTLVLASHGPMAEAMLESAAMLCGTKENVYAVCLYGEDSIEVFQEKLKKVIPENEESILLVDIPGGTPSNQGMQLLATHPKLRVIAGMNLMMVLEALLQIEHCKQEELLMKLIHTGQTCIQEMKFIEQEQDELDAMLE